MSLEGLVNMAQSERKSKEQEKQKTKPIKLDWKDYLAISIAALQTVLLPFILLIIAILVIAIFLGFSA